MAPLPGSVRPLLPFPPFSLRMCAFAAEEGGEKEVLDKLSPLPPRQSKYLLPYTYNHFFM